MFTSKRSDVINVVFVTKALEKIRYRAVRYKGTCLNPNKVKIKKYTYGTVSFGAVPYGEMCSNYMYWGRL